jgi:hypothetical protein
MIYLTASKLYPWLAGLPRAGMEPAGVPGLSEVEGSRREPGRAQARFRAPGGGGRA